MTTRQADRCERCGKERRLHEGGLCPVYDKDLAEKMKYSFKKQKTVRFKCKVCGTTTGPFHLCFEDTNETEDCFFPAWCGKCFDKAPCGKGKHGEGCETVVFE